MLDGREEVTLDIDATFVESGCASAERAYNGNTGFMPLVCHIDTGQILNIEFRKGNVPPAKDILPFLKDSIKVLPPGARVGNLRLDGRDAKWTSPSFATSMASTGRSAPRGVRR